MFGYLLIFDMEGGDFGLCVIVDDVVQVQWFVIVGIGIGNYWYVCDRGYGVGLIGYFGLVEQVKIGYVQMVGGGFQFGYIDCWKFVLCDQLG